jgi:H+/gluconate symporter-like permease
VHSTAPPTPAKPLVNEETAAKQKEVSSEAPILQLVEAPVHKGVIYYEGKQEKKEKKEKKKKEEKIEKVVTSSPTMIRMTTLAK